MVPAVCASPETLMILTLRKEGRDWPAGLRLPCHGAIAPVQIHLDELTV